MTRLSITTLTLLTSLAGCSSSPAPSPDDADTTPPTVVSVTPAADATGVPADAVVVMTFSEPMDRVSVEAAYASTDLTTADVTFSWNAVGDALTITPHDPLALAEGIGTDPTTVTAQAYALTIAASATDEAGNPLTAPLDLRFETQKRMTASLGLIPALTRYRLYGGVIGSSLVDLKVGDYLNASAYKSFVTFDLASLPERIDVIEAAELGVRQIKVDGTPFDLGAVGMSHVTYATVDVAEWSGVLAMLGDLSSTAALGPRSLDVTAAVADDHQQRAARGNLSQYRLEFPTISNDDGTTDTVEFARSTFNLAITYLAP